MNGVIFRRSAETAGLVGLLAALSAGQISFEFGAGAGLGFQSPVAASPIVKISDTIAAIVSPSATPDYASETPTIVLITKALGLYEPHFYAIPTYGPDPNAVHTTVTRLDDLALCMPGSGPDQTFGTADDRILLLAGLEFPGIAVLQDIPLDRRGPSLPGLGLMALGPRTIAWIDPGDDFRPGTGDERIVVVDDLGNKNEIHEFPFDDGSGLDAEIVSMSPYRHGLSILGPDLVKGTVDDELAMLWRDDSGPRLARVPLGSGIVRPIFGARWPLWGGGDFLVLPYPGADGVLGGSDDELTVVGPFSDRPQVRRADLDRQKAWNLIYGPANIGLDEGGGFILPVMGPDDHFGGPDDGLYFVENPLLGGGRHEVVEVGGGLAIGATPGPQMVPNEIHALGGVTVVAHFGQNKLADVDDGLAVIRRSGDARVVLQSNFYSPIRRLVSLSDDAVLCILSGGESVHCARLGTSQPHFSLVPGILDAFENELVAISPTAVFGSRYGAIPPQASAANDLIQMWRLPGDFAFGAPTEAATGYGMRAQMGEYFAQLGGGLFFIDLEDAPPSSFAYLLVSTGRDSIRFLPDAEFLVSFEELVTAQFWFTLGNGRAFFPVIAPSDPQLAGLSIHAQWLVYDPLDSRGFQLSQGLTVVF